MAREGNVYKAKNIWACERGRSFYLSVEAARGCTDARRVNKYNVALRKVGAPGCARPVIIWPASISRGRAG